MILKYINDFIENGTLDDNDRAGTPYYFDEERVLINYAKLVPGYVYTFTSMKNITEDEIPSLDEYQTGSKQVKPYFDRRPIFISLGQEGPMEIGLNLKMLPLTFRKWFLRRYFKFIYKILETLVDDSGEFMELNDRMKYPRSAPLFKINREIARLATDQSGFNVNFLVDKYTRSEMGNPLSIIDWEYVPQLCQYEYKNDGSIISKTPVSYFWQKFV